MKNYFNGYNAGPMDFGQPEQHKKDGNSSSAVTLLEEGGVRFRIYEQGVNSVKVQFDDEENEVRYPLVKDRDGVWNYMIFLREYILSGGILMEKKNCVRLLLLFFMETVPGIILMCLMKKQTVIFLRMSLMAL